MRMDSGRTLVHSGRRPRYPTVHRPPIRAVDRRDIRASLQQAATESQVPPALVLPCITAEPALDPRAECWGLVTADAKAAVASNDRAKLKSLIAQAGNDMSFGFGQRIVIFRYFGNRQGTLGSVLAVRQYVFLHTHEDLPQAALFARRQLANQGDLPPVGGDKLLGALACYNAGHLPSPDDSYWEQRAGTVNRYTRSLVPPGSFSERSKQATR